jgi:hypothetical protein
MGENLALNVESRGYRVAVFNRTTSVVDHFMEGRAKGKQFVGCHTRRRPGEEPRRAAQDHDHGQGRAGRSIS